MGIVMQKMVVEKKVSIISKYMYNLPMKQKTTKRFDSGFSNGNSIKMFLGILVSVISMFAVVYLAQQSLFLQDSKAANYLYSTNVTMNLLKRSDGTCNKEIKNYNVRVVYKAADSTGELKTFATKDSTVTSFTTSGKKLAIQDVSGPTAVSTVYYQVTQLRQDGTVIKTLAETKLGAFASGTTGEGSMFIDCK